MVYRSALQRSGPIVPSSCSVESSHQRRNKGFRTLGCAVTGRENGRSTRRNCHTNCAFNVTGIMRNITGMGIPAACRAQRAISQEKTLCLYPTKALNYPHECVSHGVYPYTDTPTIGRFNHRVLQSRSAPAGSLAASREHLSGWVEDQLSRNAVHRAALATHGIEKVVSCVTH